MLSNILRPSFIPSFKTIRLFSNRIISEDSLAISAAVSTDMPTSAAIRESESLIPSPRNPTT